MPLIPRKRPKRVAVRYLIRKVDDLYWAAAFDQGSKRYQEADFVSSNRDEVCKVARERVNKSFTTD